VSGNTAFGGSGGGGIFNYGTATLEAGAIICGNSEPQCQKFGAFTGICPSTTDGTCPSAT
jgi:hypothetical protein